MELSQQLLFILSALGAFNGILLSSYFFFFSQQKKLANYLLGGLILALSLRIGKSVLVSFNPNLAKIYLQIGLSGCFLIGPLLYYYVKSSVHQIQEFPALWKFGLSCWVSLILIIGFAFPYETNYDFWNPYFVSFIYWQWSLFILASAWVLKPWLKKSVKSPKEITQEEGWVLSIFIGNLIIHLAYRLVPIMPYISGAIAFSLIIYGFGVYFLLKQKKRSPQISYADKKIEVDEANTLLAHLKAEMNKQTLYQNTQLKLKDVADVLNITPHRLSQLLNDNLGKNFAGFINEYRVEAAKQLLGTHNHLTLEAIGYEVGFKSKSTFFATFKKMTGKTPAQFKKSLVHPS